MSASAARRRSIAACQSVADRFWHSKLYFPVCFLMLAVFMAAGLPVVGGVLVMSTLIFLLLFCDDLLSVLFPVVLLAMVGTEFYDELYSLLRFWWIGLLAAAALLVHIGAYARAPRNGGCLHGMVAVSVATLLGGLGFISREEYFAPTALYYSLGLGVVMLLVYLLCRSEADRARDYDVAERMLQILYAGGLFTGFVVALFYARHTCRSSCRTLPRSISSTAISARRCCSSRCPPRRTLPRVTGGTSCRSRFCTS